MSLLLDALKKAADDKQKTAQQQPAEEAIGPVVTENEPELTLQASDDEVQNSSQTEELTLDVLDTDTTETPGGAQGMAKPEAAEQNVDDGASQLASSDNTGSHEQKAYTVSDEALSMLI